MTKTKPQVYPDEKLDSAYTSLQGYVTCKYTHIVEVFGLPNSKGDGYKVAAEWILSTPAGVATLYNYKNGKNYNPRYGLKVENITDWHIGGKSEAVVQYVQEALLSNPSQK